MSEPVLTKICRDCGSEKSLDQFPIQKNGRFSRHPLCKPCRAVQERRRYLRERIAILERSRTDDRRKDRVRWRALARKYGLSRHEHASLYVAQRGCCAICERRQVRLVVDHDHATDEVRGLLCVTCNFALGELMDDPARCDAAARYLEATR